MGQGLGDYEHVLDALGAAHRPSAHPAKQRPLENCHKSSYITQELSVAPQYLQGQQGQGFL